MSFALAPTDEAFVRVSVGRWWRPGVVHRLKWVTVQQGHPPVIMAAQSGCGTVIDWPELRETARPDDRKCQRRGCFA